MTISGRSSNGNYIYPLITGIEKDPKVLTLLNAFIDGVLDIKNGIRESRGVIYPAAVENIRSGGYSLGTEINNGGTQNIYSGGKSNVPIIDDGGLLNVYSGGNVVDAKIVNGCKINVFMGGVLNGLSTPFDSVTKSYILTPVKSISTITLEDPAALKGTFRGWHVNDIIDLKNTLVKSVTNTQSQVDINYGSGQHVTWGLADLQADMKVVGVSDGHGGTNLQLVHV